MDKEVIELSDDDEANEIIELSSDEGEPEPDEHPWDCQCEKCLEIDSEKQREIDKNVQEGKNLDGYYSQEDTKAKNEKRIKRWGEKLQRDADATAEDDLQNEAEKTFSIIEKIEEDKRRRQNITLANERLNILVEFVNKGRDQNDRDFRLLENISHLYEWRNASAEFDEISDEPTGITQEINELIARAKAFEQLGIKKREQLVEFISELYKNKNEIQLQRFLGKHPHSEMLQEFRKMVDDDSLVPENGTIKQFREILESAIQAQKKWKTEPILKPSIFSMIPQTPEKEKKKLWRKHYHLDKNIGPDPDAFMIPETDNEDPTNPKEFETNKKTRLRQKKNPNVVKEPIPEPAFMTPVKTENKFQHTPKPTNGVIIIDNTTPDSEEKTMPEPKRIRKQTEFYGHTKKVNTPPQQSPPPPFMLEPPVKPIQPPVKPTEVLRKPVITEQMRRRAVNIVPEVHLEPPHLLPQEFPDTPEIVRGDFISDMENDQELQEHLLNQL